MKKGLALEMVGRLIIAVVIAAVGIGLVTHFLGVDLDVRGRLGDAVDHVLRGSYVDSNAKPRVINESYTSTRMANYIKSCWDDTRDTKQDKQCFVMQGNFSGVDEMDVLTILSGIDPKVPPNTNITADFSTTDMVMIYYDYSDDVIDVRS